MRLLVILGILAVTTVTVIARNVRFYWLKNPVPVSGYSLVIYELGQSNVVLSTNSFDVGTNTSYVFDLKTGKRYKAHLYAYETATNGQSNMIKILSDPSLIYAAIPNPPGIRVTPN